MIVNFFNRTKPINLVFLSILLFIFYIIAIISSNGDFSFSFFFNKTINLFFILSSLLALSFIISKNSLTKESDLGILLYVLLFGAFGAIFFADEFIISHFFLLLSFRRIYSLRTKLHPKKKLFDSGFWMGIAVIFYPLTVFFILLNIIAIFVYNKIDWKHFLIPFLGFFTPLFLVYTYFFYYDNTSSFLQLLDLSVAYSLSYSSTKLIVPIIFVSILGVWSVFRVSAKYAQESANFKSSWIITIFQLIIAVVIVLLSPNKNGKEWVFVFFPLSLILANNMQLIKRKWLKEVIVSLFIIVIVSVRFL